MYLVYVCTLFIYTYIYSMVIIFVYHYTYLVYICTLFVYRYIYFMVIILSDRIVM